MSKAQDVLQGIATANGYVSLAITLGEEIIPLGKALVQEIRGIGQPVETISYALLLQQDTAELDAIEKLSTDDIDAINVELAKLGIAPIKKPS